MATKFQAIQRVLVVTLGLNLISTAAKLAVGYATGSLSLIAGGFDALLDAFSNLIGLIGVRVASRPPDADHPYGHRKFETLAALVIAFLLLVTIVEIVRNALARLASGGAPQVNVWSFAAVLLGLALGLLTTLYERRRGSQLKSEFLLADAAHTGAHVLVDLSLIVGLFLIRLGYPIVDPLLALGIAAVIAKIGWDILRSASRTLSDQAMLDPREIERRALQVPGVVGTDSIRSRGQEDNVYIDLHIHVAPEIPLDRAHDIAEAVQERLTREISGVRDVVVHVEPPEGPAPSLPLPERIEKVAQRLGHQVHEIRVHRLEGRLCLDLHLEVEEDLSLEEAHGRASVLEQAIRAELPEVAEVYVHIEPKEIHSAEPGQPAPEAGRVEHEVARLRWEIEGLQDVRDLVVRRSGGKLFVSLNGVLARDMPVDRAHDLASEFERRLKERVGEVDQVLIHLEPPQAVKER